MAYLFSPIFFSLRRFPYPLASSFGLLLLLCQAGTTNHLAYAEEEKSSFVKQVDHVDSVAKASENPEIPDTKKNLGSSAGADVFFDVGDKRTPDQKKSLPIFLRPSPTVSSLPPGCFSEAEMQEKVGDILTNTDHVPEAEQSTLKKRIPSISYFYQADKNGVDVHIFWQGKERLIHGKSCKSVNQAAAVSIALLLELEREQIQITVPPKADTEPVQTSNEEKEEEPEPLSFTNPREQTFQKAPSNSDRVHVLTAALRLAPVLGFGSIASDGSFGVSLSSAFTAGNWQVALGGRIFPEKSHLLSQGSASLSLTEGVLDVCRRIGTDGLHASLCGTLAIGALRAESYGYTENWTASKLRVASGASVEAGGQLGKLPLEVWVRMEMAFPFQSRTFVIENRGQIYRTEASSQVLSIGLSYLIPVFRRKE